MKKDKLVSVVTATYNMGKYLPIAINSVLNQTYPHVEIHVVDDGSTDNTREIMEQYKDDPRVYYYYQENQGQALAKNRGIEESKGEYVAFLDADDMWKPDKLDKQLPLFKTSEEIGVVYSDVAYMDGEGNILPKKSNKNYYSGWITQYLFVDNFINFNSTVVKRKCLEELGGFDVSLPMSIDWDLWLRISTKYQFVYLDEPTFYYRLWSGQMSHNFERRFKCTLDIMRRFQKEHADLLPKEVIRKAWAHTYTNRGWKSRAITRKKLEAFKYYLKALKIKPDYIPAWKEIVKLALL